MIHSNNGIRVFNIQYFRITHNAKSILLYVVSYIYFISGVYRAEATYVAIAMYTTSVRTYYLA